jgi:hypothetical protein
MEPNFYGNPLTSCELSVAGVATHNPQLTTHNQFIKDLPLAVQRVCLGHSIHLQ